MSASPEIARANGRKGGRPKGSKSQATIEKEAALTVYRKRIEKNAGQLFDSQMTLARGQTFLYKIEKECVVGPKGGKSYHAKRPELVTSQDEIESYLDGELESNQLEEPGATYYFLTTKEPNNHAIDSMLDRLWGRAPQSVELTGKDGAALAVIGMKIVKS